MTDPLTARIWLFRSYYLTLCLFVMIWKILPLGIDDGAIPVPNLIMALTFAWVLRQPNTVPLGAIAFIFLTNDFLTHAPVGLGALIMVLASERLRRLQPEISNMTFLGEFGMVTGTIALCTLAERVILGVLLAEQAPFLQVALHAIVTIACYPVVVVISKYLLGLDRLNAADPDNV